MLDAPPPPTPEARMATSIQLKRRGPLFVLSSPSGAGKTTIARMLLAQDEGISLSVSATTRPIREGELEGRDYHFVIDAEFDRMVESGQFWNGRTCSGGAMGHSRTRSANPDRKSTRLNSSH